MMNLGPTTPENPEIVKEREITARVKSDNKNRTIQLFLWFCFWVAGLSICVYGCKPVGGWVYEPMLKGK